MPTPVGHGIAAVAAWSAFRPLAVRTLSNPWFYLVVLSALGPDLDFVPGLMLGNEALFHRAGSHSIGGAAIYGALLFAGALAVTRSGKKAPAAAAIGSALYLSHLLLELFGSDPGEPYGIQLFWPLSESFFISPVTIFPALDRHPFDLSLFSRALPVLAVETLLLVPLVALAIFTRHRRSP